MGYGKHYKGSKVLILSITYSHPMHALQPTYLLDCIGQLLGTACPAPFSLRLNCFSSLSATVTS